MQEKLNDKCICNLRICVITWLVALSNLSEYAVKMYYKISVMYYCLLQDASVIPLNIKFPHLIYTYSCISLSYLLCGAQQVIARVRNTLLRPNTETFIIANKHSNATRYRFAATVCILRYKANTLLDFRIHWLKTCTDSPIYQKAKNSECLGATF